MGCLPFITLAVLAGLSQGQNWDGPDITKCPFVECQNGGTCKSVMEIRDYVCQCTPGFTGEFCEGLAFEGPDTTKCPFVQCQNGGTCKPIYQQNDTRICQCTPGFTGEFCEGYSHAPGSMQHETFQTELEKSFKVTMTRDNFDDTDFQLECREAGQVEGNTTFDDEYNSMFIDDVSTLTETPSIQELKEMLKEEDLFFGDDDEDYKDLSVYSEHPWFNRLLSAKTCPRTQNYGCRSVHWKMPCMKENLGAGRVRYCCPLYPHNVVTKVAHCNCCKCAILSPYGVQCGGCTRRYKWERVLSVCRTYNHEPGMEDDIPILGSSSRDEELSCEESLQNCITTAANSERDSADWHTFRDCTTAIKGECPMALFINETNVWIDSHIERMESTGISPCDKKLNDCHFKAFANLPLEISDWEEDMKCVNDIFPGCYHQSNGIWWVNEQIRRHQGGEFNNPLCVANVTKCGDMYNSNSDNVVTLLGYRRCLVDIQLRCHDQSLALWNANEKLWKTQRGPILMSGPDSRCEDKVDTCRDNLDQTTRQISDVNDFITCLELIEPKCHKQKDNMIWADRTMDTLTDAAANTNNSRRRRSTGRRSTAREIESDAPWSEWYTRRHYMHVPKNCYCKTDGC